MLGRMTINRKDLGAGLSFLTMAIVYGWIALRDLPVGTTLSMGPGYFPMVLCGIIGLIGAILTIRAVWSADSVSLPGHFAWRPVIAISVAVIIFGTFLRELGLFLAVFATAYLCSQASRQVTRVRALGLAFVLAVICTGVFAYGVRLPLPVVGTWFKGA